MSRKSVLFTVLEGVFRATSFPQVGSACRELTFEERKAQLTGDGLGADRVETVVEEVTAA